MDKQNTEKEQSQPSEFKVRRTRSIGFRMSLLVSVAIMIFGALSIYLVVNRQSMMYRNEKTRQWEILIDSLTPNLMNLMASSDFSGLSQILDRVASEQNEIHHLFLCNEHGEIIFSIDLKMEGETLSGEKIKTLAAGRFRDAETDVQVQQFEREIRSGTSRLGTLYMGFNFLPSLEKERVASILTLENAIQGAVKKYLIEFDFYQVHFITKEMIQGIGDIAYFEVLSADGTIVSSPEEARILQSASDEYDLKVLEEASTRKAVWMRRLKVDDRPVLEVSLGMFEGAGGLGMIQVGYDLSSLQESIRRGNIILGAVALVSIGMAVFMAMMIATRITRPVVLLSNIAREVGGGNLEVEAQVRSGGDEMRLLGAAFNEMIKGLKERDFVKDTLGRYVTKQVADEILRNPEMLAIGGKKQEVTILFSDIRGFTPFAEGRSPEEVLSHLNEYLSAMVDVIIKYEGIVDKFIGDAIMAVYGSPIRKEDDPIRAVRSAIEMQKRLNELNAKWVSESKVPFKIGIGLNTGEVIAGNIGDVRKMEYTVIGDNVNLASRIEGLTKDFNCPIIISESTYEKVKDYVDVKKLEAVTVKGKSQSVDIYELIGYK